MTAMNDPAERPESRVQAILSAAELASAADLPLERIAALVDFGIVEPASPDGSTFTAATAYRLRRMVRLHADLGVSFVGAAIIVDLLERIDRLEKAPRSVVGE